MRRDLGNLSLRFRERSYKTPIAYRKGQLFFYGLFGVILIGLFGAVLVPTVLANSYILAASRSTNNEQKLAFLEKSLQWSPNNIATYRSLALLYGQHEQFSVSVSMLEKALRLQPDNIQVRHDLALAYEAVGELQQADVMWRSIGMSPDKMISWGDSYFNKLQYKEALKWYDRAARAFNEQYFTNVFRQAISAFYIEPSRALELFETASKLDNTFTIYQLERSLRVDGGQFRWLLSLPRYSVSYGTPLSYSRQGSTGYMWWEGEAVLVVNASQAGQYRLLFNLRHSNPSPVEMAVGIDGMQDKKITLKHGDDSWEDVELLVDLEEGIHTINIWFLNDGIVDGINRDAAIGWVLIERE